jgi:hypothetical protein
MRKLILLSMVSALTMAPLASVVRGEDAKATPTAPAAEAVDFRKLKEFLPETVGGLKRADATGERTAMGEMKISQARGEYRQDDKPDASANVQIIDYGAMPGFADGAAAWAQIDIDQESDDEYTRTTKVGEFKALETYNKTDKTGSMQILVGGRFIITLDITGLEPATLKDTAAAMKLSELAATK